MAEELEIDADIRAKVADYLRCDDWNTDCRWPDNDSHDPRCAAHWRYAAEALVQTERNARLDASYIPQALYDSEINFRISTFWDGGFDWQLGDDLNGIKAKGEAVDFATACLELKAAALEAYPNSHFARIALQPETWRCVMTSDLSHDLSVALARIAELEDIAKEVWRLSLVIESAVRQSDPPNRPVVLALIDKARAALKKEPMP